MFGNWEYDDDPTSLVEFDAITDLFTNTGKAGEKFMSADIAEYGSDKTVICVWEGLKVIKIFTYKKQGLDVSLKRIEEISEKYEVPRSHIIIDDDGLGKGVSTFLYGCKKFNAQNKPLREENYQNLKSQCTYVLAKRINARELAIVSDDPSVKEQIIEELEQIKSKDSDKDGKLQIQPKDKTKELIGRSPDYSDALMMRMYFEIRPTATLVV